MLDANTIIAIGTVVVAVATWRAATAAKAAAQSTGRATQAQLFSTLMAEYGSPEMREALLRLRQTQDNWATNGLQQGIEHWADTFLEHGPIDNATDIARRRVVHFFRKTAGDYGPGPGRWGSQRRAPHSFRTRTDALLASADGRRACCQDWRGASHEVAQTT